MVKSVPNIPYQLDVFLWQPQPWECKLIVLPIPGHDIIRCGVITTLHRRGYLPIKVYSVPCYNVRLISGLRILGGKYIFNISLSLSSVLVSKSAFLLGDLPCYKPS